MKRIIMPDLKTQHSDESYIQEEEKKISEKKKKNFKNLISDEKKFFEKIENYKSEILETEDWIDLNDFLTKFLFEEKKNFEKLKKIKPEYLKKSFIEIIEGHNNFIEDLNHLKIKKFQDFIQILKKSDFFEISENLENSVKKNIEKRIKEIKKNFLKQCDKARRNKIRKRKMKVKERTRNLEKMIEENKRGKIR